MLRLMRRAAARVGVLVVVSLHGCGGGNGAALRSVPDGEFVGTVLARNGDRFEWLIDCGETEEGEPMPAGRHSIATTAVRVAVFIGERPEAGHVVDVPLAEWLPEDHRWVVMVEDHVARSITDFRAPTDHNTCP